MKRRYVQFSGWARLGALLSTVIDRWHNRHVPDALVRKRRAQVIAWSEGLERGLWLENNDGE